MAPDLKGMPLMRWLTSWAFKRVSPSLVVASPCLQNGCWLKLPVVGNLAPNSLLVMMFSLFITRILSETLAVLTGQLKLLSRDVYVVLVTQILSLTA